MTPVFYNKFVTYGPYFWKAAGTGTSLSYMSAPQPPRGQSSMMLYTRATKKTREKGTFFHRKSRNARDALRVSKAVFLKEKGTFEICLSRKRVPFSPNIFFPTREGKLIMISFNTQLEGCAFLTKTCLGLLFFLYVNSFRGWFSSGSKNLFRGVLEKFWSRMCTLLYLSGPPGSQVIA